MTLHPRSVVAHGLRKRRDWSDPALIEFLVVTFEMTDGQAHQALIEFRQMEQSGP